MKVKFDLKYRQQIESGEYKVETADGRQVRIICWDTHNPYRDNDIVALATSSSGEAENILRYYSNGHLISDSANIGNKDLIVVIPDEDERIKKIITDSVFYQYGAGVEYKDVLDYIDKLEKEKEYKSLPLDLSVEDVETIKTALRESGLGSTSNRKVYDKLENIPESAYYLSTVGPSKLYSDGTVARRTIGYLEKKDSSSDDYCKENCKGYQETGKCFFDEPCLGKKEWDKNLLDTDEEREKLKHEAWSDEDGKHYNDVLSGLKYAYEDLTNHKSFDSAKDIKEAFDWMKSRFKLFFNSKDESF